MHAMKVISLVNNRVAFVPVGVLLKSSCRLNRQDVVACSGYEFKPYWQILLRKATRNGNRRQSAKIAYGSQRVRKREAGFQIKRKRRCGDGLRRSDEHVEAFENCVHFLLQDFTNFEGLPVVRGGILFVQIACDLPKRVCKFAQFTGANQGAKRSRRLDLHDKRRRFFPRAFWQGTFFHPAKELS